MGTQWVAPKRPPGEALLPLHASANYLFWCLHKMSMSIVAEELDKAGADITPVQYAALSAAQAHPGADQVTLAAIIGYDAATMGGLIDRLAKKGLVSRRIHPRDRRARAIYLEAAGAELLASTDAVVEAAQARILAPLPERDRARFLAMAAKLIPEDLPHETTF